MVAGERSVCALSERAMMNRKARERKDWYLGVLMSG
jgi:hypothetical protein